MSSGGRRMMAGCAAGDNPETSEAVMQNRFQYTPPAKGVGCGGLGCGALVAGLGALFLFTPFGEWLITAMGWFFLIVGGIGLVTSPLYWLKNRRRR